MSQQTATARVAPRALPRRQGSAPQPLRVVPAAMGKPGNGLFAALCMVLLTGGLVALLMLNTAMAEGSFTLNHLQNTSGELADTQQALTQAIDAQRAPANLAARAAKLGMVPADSAAFLRLADGKVLGVASPAKKDPAFTVVTAPQAAPTGAGKAVTATTPTTTLSKKGDVTTTTVVVTKPDGSVVTTVTSVNAATKTTTTTTTTTTPNTTPKTKPKTKPKATGTPAAPAH